MSRFLTKKDEARIEAWIVTLELGLEPPKEYSKEEIVSRLDLPYRAIASGKHRIVYDLGKRFVLKVPRVRKGIQCNLNEQRLYRQSPPRLRRHLGEIVESGYGWLVMEKMSKKPPSSEKYRKQLEDIVAAFRESGVRISDLHTRKGGQPKKGNLRLDKKNDAVVIIDYANQYPVPPTA